MLGQLRNPSGLRSPSTGLNLLLASTLVSLVWRLAVRERLIRPDAADADVKLLTKRLTPGLAGYLAMIVLGLFLPVLAVVGYLAICLRSPVRRPALGGLG